MEGGWGRGAWLPQGEGVASQTMAARHCLVQLLCQVLAYCRIRRFMLFSRLLCFRQLLCCAALCRCARWWTWPTSSSSTTTPSRCVVGPCSLCAPAGRGQPAACMLSRLKALPPGPQLPGSPEHSSEGQGWFCPLQQQHRHAAQHRGIAAIGTRPAPRHPLVPPQGEDHQCLDHLAKWVADEAKAKRQQEVRGPGGRKRGGWGR